MALKSRALLYSASPLFNKSGNIDKWKSAARAAADVIEKAIYNTLQKMDHNLIEAAQDLGASPTRVFGKVILPLSMPGVMSGIVMVFMPTVSTFAIAELLTMNNIKLFGTTVQENIYNGMWNYGAALSLIMLLLIGITILFTNEEDGASNESGGVI